MSTTDADWIEKLSHYRTVWNLDPDSEPFRSYSSWLQLVRMPNAAKALLKVPFRKDERDVIPLLDWFGGGGMAIVFGWDSEAQLMERLCRRSVSCSDV